MGSSAGAAVPDVGSTSSEHDGLRAAAAQFLRDSTPGDEMVACRGGRGECMTLGRRVQDAEEAGAPRPEIDPCPGCLRIVRTAGMTVDDFVRRFAYN